MAKKKEKTLKEHTLAELGAKYEETRKELFELKNEYRLNRQLKKPHMLKKTKRDILSNRYRIQGTTVSTLQDEDFSVNLPALLNLNYRMSNIDSLALEKNFSLSFSLEPGVNIFFDDVMILPYIKFGQEFRFYKYLYVDLHLGGSILFPFGFYPFYFYGSEIGYIFNQTENFSFEFELGFNGIDPFYLYYFALTFSF